MKKTCFLIFIFLSFALFSKADVNIGYLAPINSNFSYFSESFLRGMITAMGKNDNIIIKDSNKQANKKLEELYLSGVDVVVGPFKKKTIADIKDKICNSSIVEIFPFSQPDYLCDNTFSYNYSPLKAAYQVAKNICDMSSGRTLVLYSDNDINRKQKDIFLKGLSPCLVNLVDIKSFQSNAGSYNKYFRQIFGIRKLIKRKSLTSEKVFDYSLKVDTAVIFSSQKDFIKIANLFNYYGIKVKNIVGSDIVINKNLFSLDRGILKKMKFITPYYLCSDKLENKLFVEKYKNRYGSYPNMMSALGYDIGVLLRDGDRVSLENKIKSTYDFNGVVGRLLFFDDTGNGVFNYRFLNYEDIEKCRKIILSR